MWVLEQPLQLMQEPARVEDPEIVRTTPNIPGCTRYVRQAMVTSGVKRELTARIWCVLRRSASRSKVGEELEGPRAIMRLQPF